MTLGGSWGLSGLLRLSSCWGGSKKNTLPEGACHLDIGPGLQISNVQPMGHLNPPRTCSCETLRSYARSKKIRQHSHQPPTPPVLQHPPLPPPVCCFLKEKCERRKKRGKEYSARGGRWRKPHFFRRAAASGLLRWL